MGINELNIWENIYGALCACSLLQVDQSAREALGLLQLCAAGFKVDSEMRVKEMHLHLSAQDVVVRQGNGLSDGTANAAVDWTCVEGKSAREAVVVRRVNA